MSETSLLRLQRLFKSMVRGERGDSACAALNPLPDEERERRLSVYENGYLARMHESLAETFEAVASQAGPDKFGEMAFEYAKRHPSKDYNLTFAGRHFPEFLENSAYAIMFPFLPDLARFEWLVCESFHAFDEKPLELSALASLSPEQWESCILIFQPSVKKHVSSWPIFEFWQLRRSSERSAEARLLDSPDRLVLYRREAVVHCRRLQEGQFRLLQGLLEGRTLGSVCADLAAGEGQEPPPVSEWFAEWAAAGLIRGYRLA